MMLCTCISSLELVFAIAYVIATTLPRVGGGYRSLTFRPNLNNEQPKKLSLGLAAGDLPMPRTWRRGLSLVY